MTFQEELLEGIPSELPQPPKFDPKTNRAPKRKEVLCPEEKKLALKKCFAILSSRMAPRVGSRIFRRTKDSQADIYVPLYASTRN